MNIMDEDIAVVGIGCNFPGGEGLDNFWRVLVEGKNCSVEIPGERFNCSSWYDPDVSRPGKTQTTKAALIDGFNELDHKFFGITEAEADFMDPQQKLLLQCSYRALEDAGIPMEKISGSRTGVYIGLMNRDFETLLNNSPSTITHYNGTGTSMSVAANRISYTFNLTGPSFAIDSACSSSLVALHSACQAIRQGDCEMALCGGVSCILEPRVFVALSKAKMISPDGTSKPFSSRADGYGRGEGCGVVLLKPLKKALESHHHIWGIISKTSVNQDGRTVTPITKPSMVQQKELLSRIYSTERDLTSVQYIEAHGTGTPVGDPIEAESISNVIAQARPQGSETIVGSVKGNIGHTESAAGVAGLIKVLLMMKHQTIVPSLFYSEQSSSIDAKALNIKIPTKAEKWQQTNPDGRVAGINNFGFGGTNAHAVIREHIDTPNSVPVRSEKRKLFILSAMTEKSLKMCISDTHRRLCTDEPVDLQSIAYTSACRRSHLKQKYRKAFLSSSVAELQNQLKMALDKKISPSKPGLKLVFVFCGNGVTYRGMCKQLLKEEPVFRAKVREVENLFQNHRSMCISQKIVSDYDNDDNSKPEVVQPLLFTIQVALANLLKHWGLRPDAVLGHSIGEVAAAHCSGLLSLADAVKVIYHRSTLQGIVTGGKMLVVRNVAVADILEILSFYTGKVCLAALNSPVSCVLSGHEDAIDSLHQKLKTLVMTKNLFLHVLDVPAAYHSHMMDPILSQIKERIGVLQANEKECELYSTVTGKPMSAGDFITGEYWAQNIREPVAFQKAINSAAKDKTNVVFIEISPRKALQRNIMEVLGNDITVMSSVQPDREHETLVSTMARLFELGFQIDWDNVYRGLESQPMSLPRYQFDCLKKEVYFETVRHGHAILPYPVHPLLSQMKDNNKQYACNLSSDVVPYFWEHKNNGVVIAPGSLYVELASEAAMQFIKPKKPLCSLKLSVTFQSLFVLSKDPNQLRVLLEPSEGKTTFEIWSSSTMHASGTIIYGKGPAVIEEEVINCDIVSKRCPIIITKEEVYSHLSLAGFEYGPTFRQLGEVCYGREFREALTSITVPDELLSQLYEYRLHPVVLDWFLQMASVVVQDGTCVRPCFPSAIKSVVISRPLQRVMTMYLRVTRETNEFYEVCGCFIDLSGRVLVELKCLRITFVQGSPQVVEFFHNEYRALTDGMNTVNRPKALVFEDTLGVAKALKPYLNPQSTFVSLSKSASSVPAWLTQCLETKAGVEFTEVLFMWGIQNLSQMKIETILDSLVKCCELYRQIVLALRKYSTSYVIRVITYRSSGLIVDHVSPGFVLSGMTRALAAEMSGFSFQLIDLASVSNEDIQELAHIISCSQSNQYPEILISKGHTHLATITRSPYHDSRHSETCIHSLTSQRFTLQTTDPYMMAKLSAVTVSFDETPILDKTVEVKLDKICVHSSDFFPVSVSDFQFGQTLYWSKHSTQNHKLLALDFSGTVTDVGKGVSKLKVGDHIASCYPVVASSKVILPEVVCYNTAKLPFLRDVPCVSYLVLAREIFDHILPKDTKKLPVTILSCVPRTLAKLLVEIGKTKGWSLNIQTHINDQNADYAVILLLPPYDHSMLVSASGISSVKHIVVVCKEELTSHSHLIQQKNQNVSVHVLKTSSVLQKANLQRQGEHLDHWLHGVTCGKICMPIQENTVQREVFSEMITSSTQNHSYFNVENISLIVCTKTGSLHTETNVPLLPQAKELFQKNSVYIVSGGLSGLGLETLKFIAHRGGGYIVSLSRSLPSAEIQHKVSALQRQYGALVMTLKCDVSSVTDVVRAFTAIGQRFPSCPIRGVFHSAAVLHDGLIETLDSSHFRKVLRPKVSGALNLHYATLHSKLDYFVCYSSISSFLGNASQTNYAAANSFLDTFCHYRHNLGLVGQSINWGPLNLGLLLNKVNFQRFLEAKGLTVMEISEVHESLERCLLTNNTQQVVCKFNFRNLQNHVLSQNASLRVRLSPLVQQELKGEGTEPMVQSVNSVEDYVKRLLCDLSNADIDELRESSTLTSLGIDSMSAMTMQNCIFQDCGVNVPLVKILDPNSTMSSLVLILKQSNDVDIEIQSVG
ncbi:phthioceranic/hydroxyphthioceranic acid synthase [Alosa sapidissima]|uniref:phthioceranic/hydroxyphthioceranic acid synthase n=1 Tax=Alosa sapidissima TaxID=34773 RepID=UPI001C093A07|nr:phthioceranic/hydroxyphthioceranic acid synthase [Alosa sapidissima]